MGEGRADDGGGGYPKTKLFVDTIRNQMMVVQSRVNGHAGTTYAAMAPLMKVAGLGRQNLHLNKRKKSGAHPVGSREVLYLESFPSMPVI